MPHESIAQNQIAPSASRGGRALGRRRGPRCGDRGHAPI